MRELVVSGRLALCLEPSSILVTDKVLTANKTQGS